MGISTAPCPAIRVFRIHSIPSGAQFSASAIALDMRKTTLCLSCYLGGYDIAIYVDRGFYRLTPLHATPGEIGAQWV